MHKKGDLIFVDKAWSMGYYGSDGFNGSVENRNIEYFVFVGLADSGTPYKTRHSTALITDGITMYYTTLFCCEKVEKSNV